MFTQIHPGRGNSIPNQISDGRRRRRTHRAEFKAQVVSSCRQAGVSIAAAAMASGINANLARRWVFATEQDANGGGGIGGNSRLLAGVSCVAPPPAFLPVQVLQLQSCW